jgi:hypothetical protein
LEGILGLHFVLLTDARPWMANECIHLGRALVKMPQTVARNAEDKRDGEKLLERFNFPENSGDINYRHAYY